jgi:hypothetical protein
VYPVNRSAYLGADLISVGTSRPIVAVLQVVVADWDRD